MADEEKEPAYYPNFDFAIFSIFTALVFEVGAQFGHDKQRLKRSEHWGKNRVKFNDVMAQVRAGALQAIAVSLILIIASAIGIALTTRNLEERMRLILNGLSYITASIVFGSLSFGIAVWTGLYFCVWSPIEPATSTSLVEVRFKVRCGYYRLFTRYFFFLLPFYEGVNAWKIPLSMIGGVVVGLFIGYGIYIARRKGHGWWQKWTKVIVVFFMSIMSSIFLADAAWYIASVWSSSHVEEREDVIALWWSVFLMLGFFGLAILHAACYYYSCRQMHSHSEALQASMSASGNGSKSVTRSAATTDLMASNRPRMAASLILEAFSKTKEGEEVAAAAAAAPSSLMSLPEEKGGGGDGEEEEEDVENVVLGEPAETACTPPGDEQSPPDKPSKDNDDNDEQQEEAPKKGESSNEEEKDPTYKEMLSHHWTPCCGCLCGSDVPMATKAWAFMSWTVWLVLVLFCLYLVAINIGATYQQQASKAKFPEVNKVLYSQMDAGPVCAFDNKGADSNITTFADKDAAHAAGFLIVHCGPCAACSDWHNLRLEYTTRNTLADDSRKCAQKSLTPGGRNAVLECMESEPITFQGKCAECWTDDVLCSKSFCALIFLQSTLINAVTDLAVNDHSITSASCEEANCEAGNPGDFVKCSGATRRRMNVSSDIARPGDQRCSIVDVNWAELFPGE